MTRKILVTTKSKKSTPPKLLSGSKNSKKKFFISKTASQSANPTLEKSETGSKNSQTPITNNPFEVLNTDGPKTIDISDLVKPRAEEVKRKRGRPSNASKASDGAPPKSDSLSQGGAGAATGSPSSALSNQPIIAPSAIKPLLKAPFTFAAQYTEIPEINLTEKEADDLAPSLEVVMRQYSSQMNSPHAPLYAFLVSFGIIGFQKVLIYRSVMRMRAEELKRKQEFEKGVVQ